MNPKISLAIETLKEAKESLHRAYHDLSSAENARDRSGRDLYTNKPVFVGYERMMDKIDRVIKELEGK